MSSHGALSPQHTLESSSHEQNQTVMWAVTSMASVPPGSVLINPQVSYLDKTGRDLNFCCLQKNECTFIVPKREF
jgi:hypothetical protein